MKKFYLMLFSCVMILFAGCATEIDLTPYVEVDFEGYDGEGTASYEIDYEELITDYEETFDYDEKDLEKKSGQRFLEDVMEAIDGELSEDEELSNGDEITFSWDLDVEDLEKEFKVKFVSEEVTVKVKRLDEEKQAVPTRAPEPTKAVSAIPEAVPAPAITSTPIPTVTPTPIPNITLKYYYETEEETLIYLLAEKFMELYPHIRVETVQMYDTQSDLSAAAAAGEFPDIIVTSNPDILLANGYWADITEYWKKDSETNLLMETIEEYGIGMFGTDIRFAVPALYWPTAMFLERNAIGSLNLDMPRTDWTWEEMVQLVKDATCYDSNMMYYGLGYSVPLGDLYSTAAGTKNGTMGEFGFSGTAFNSADWAYGLQQFADLNFAGYVAPQTNTLEMENWTGDYSYVYQLTGHVAVMSELLCEYQNTWAYNMEYGMSTEEIYGLDIVPYAIPSVNDEGVENTLALMYMGGISTSCEYPEEAYLLLKFMTWGIDGWQARLDIYEDESLTNEWGVAYKNWNMPTPLTTDNTVWSRYEGLFPQDEYKKLFWSDYFASITRPVPFSWCCIAGDANFEEYYLEAIGVSQVVMEGIANAMDYVDEMDRQITYYHGDAMLSYFGKNSIYDMLGYKVLTDEEEQIYRDIVDSMY